MANLPGRGEQPWDQVLRAFLQVTHKDDGTLKDDAVAATPVVTALGARVDSTEVALGDQVRLSSEGIFPGTGADLTQQIVELIEETGGNAEILFDRPGVYLCNEVSTLDTAKAILYFAVDNLTLSGVPGARLRSETSTTEVALIRSTGAALPTGWADYRDYRFPDATVYSLTGAYTKGVSTVTLASAGDAANFDVDDWILVRTGNVTNHTARNPDAEINRIRAISGANIELYYPTAKPYQQEYWADATQFGRTSTAVTAWPAAFGIANISDRLLHNVRIRNLGLELPNSIDGQTFVLGQVVGVEVSDCEIDSNGRIHGGGLYRNGKFMHNTVYQRSSGLNDYPCFSGDMATSDVEIAHNTVIAERGTWLHIREGMARAHCHHNTLIARNPVSPATAMVPVLFRAYDIDVSHNLLAAYGITSLVRVDPDSPGGGRIAFNDCYGNTGAMMSIQASGWDVEGNRPESGQVSYQATAEAVTDASPAMRERVSAKWVADDQPVVVVANLPAAAIVDRITIHARQAFNGTTPTVSVGTDADNDRFVTATDVSTIGLKSVTGGISLGLYQQSAQTVKAFLAHGGSAPTMGRALVEVYWHQTATEVA